MKNPIVRLDDKVAGIDGWMGCLAKGAYAFPRGISYGIELVYSFPYFFRRFSVEDTFGSKADVGSSDTFSFIQAWGGLGGLIAGGLSVVALSSLHPLYLGAPVVTNVLSSMPTVVEMARDYSYGKKNGKDAPFLRKDVFSTICEGDTKYDMRFKEVRVDEPGSRINVDIGIETYVDNNVVGTNSISGLDIPYQHGSRIDAGREETDFGSVLAQARPLLVADQREALRPDEILGLADLYVKVGSYFASRTKPGKSFFDGYERIGRTYELAGVYLADDKRTELVNLATWESAFVSMGEGFLREIKREVD